MVGRGELVGNMAGLGYFIFLLQVPNVVGYSPEIARHRSVDEHGNGFNITIVCQAKEYCEEYSSRTGVNIRVVARQGTATYDEVLRFIPVHTPILRGNPASRFLLWWQGNWI